MIEHPFLTFDEDGRLQSDLRCIGCGYNLRTLTQESDCPECGSHVLATLAQLPLWGVKSKLWTQDPGWAARLCRGYAHWNVCLVIAVGLLMMFQLLPPSLFFGRLSYGLHLLVVLGWIVPCLLIGWGMWMATISPKHEAQSTSWQIGRTVCRLIAIVRVLLWMCIGFATLADLHAFNYFWFLRQFGIWFFIAMETASWWAILLYQLPLVRSLTPQCMPISRLSIGVGAITSLLVIVLALLLIGDEYGYGIGYGLNYNTFSFQLYSMVTSLVQISTVIFAFFWLTVIYTLTWNLWRTMRRLVVVR